MIPHPFLRYAKISRLKRMNKASLSFSRLILGPEAINIFVRGAGSENLDGLGRGWPGEELPF